VKSDKQDAIDAIGQQDDADINKLFGGCDSHSEGVKKALKADPADKGHAMIDAIADDYLEDDTNDLPIDDWLDMKLPKKTS
jgi:hypothetical protein